MLIRPSLVLHGNDDILDWVEPHRGCEDLFDLPGTGLLPHMPASALALFPNRREQASSTADTTNVRGTSEMTLY